MQFGAEVSTRERVALAVLRDGPVRAADLAADLGLTAAAVRRHLDAMTADGLLEEHPGAAGGSARGRGRPARAFVLTDAGHAAMTTTYDDLAAAALRFVSAELGRPAVDTFARARGADLEARYSTQVRLAGPGTAERVEALARALSADGYAARSRPVAQGVSVVQGVSLPRGTPVAAVQLCQGHCPVQHVASEFPELCEAETQAFGRLLGVHVSRLATLAHGEHVCTTHVPIPGGPPGSGPPPPRSTSTAEQASHTLVPTSGGSSR